MSFDQKPYNPPVGTVTPKKSKAKWWIFGCLGLLLLCGGGMAVVGYPIYKASVATIQAMNDAKATIENSEQAKQILGAPLEVGTPTNTSSSSVNGEVVMEITYPVTGSEKSGDVTAHIKGSPFGEMKIERLELDVDGETHSLDSLDDFNLDIKDGN